MLFALPFSSGLANHLRKEPRAFGNYKLPLLKPRSVNASPTVSSYTPTLFLFVAISNDFRTAIPKYRQFVVNAVAWKWLIQTYIRRYWMFDFLQTRSYMYHRSSASLNQCSLMMWLSSHLWMVPRSRNYCSWWEGSMLNVAPWDWRASIFKRITTYKRTP